MFDPRTGFAAGILALSPVFATPLAAASVADLYSSFFVFGDSLSDPGNLYAAAGLPASPPYFEGRFSNGPVWAEHIAAGFTGVGAPAFNFAFGGARAVANDDGIPDLDQQIASAASLGALAGSRPLAAVWAGANDILDTIASLSPVAVGEAARAAADNVIAAVQTLGAQGFDDIAVFNLPDLGSVPRFSLLIPQAGDLARLGSDTFNARLNEGLADADVTRIDMDRLFADLLADPAAFGVSDVTLPCLFPDAQSAEALGQPLLCSEDVADGRAFFDSIHPNATVHAAIAAEVNAALTPIPVPAALPIMASGLGMIALFARWRKAAV